MSDRRNYARRAAATQWVVMSLLAGPVTAVDHAAVPPSAAHRILRGLGIRGLARVTPEGWRAAPPLTAPVALRPGDVDDTI